MGYIKIGGLATLILGVVVFAFTSMNGKSAQEKWHAEGEQNPKADFEISAEPREMPKTRYVADTAHSSILFKATHWEIVDILGWFADYEIVMLSDREDFTDAVIEAKIKINSVFMPNKRMQSHIQGHEYFDTENNPDVLYKGSELVHVKDNQYLLKGHFTLLGKTVYREMQATYRGHAYPNEKPEHGWKIKTFLTHQDFGWDNSATLHSGRVFLQDTIHIECNLRME